MNRIKQANVVTFFGIPIYKSKERNFITTITTLNWNLFHESLSKRQQNLILDINNCKDEKSLEILRNSLLKLEEEKELFQNSHVISD